MINKEFFFTSLASYNNQGSWCEETCGGHRQREWSFVKYGFCNTHHCNTLCPAQACIGKKNPSSPKLAELLKIVVERVNYLCNSGMKHSIFKELCNEIGSEFEILLYHSNIWGLSPGKGVESCFCDACRFWKCTNIVLQIALKILSSFFLFFYFGVYGQYLWCPKSAKAGW